MQSQDNMLNKIKVWNNFQNSYEKLLKDCGISMFRLTLQICGYANSSEYVLRNVRGDEIKSVDEIENDQMLIYSNTCNDAPFDIGWQQRTVLYHINEGNSNPLRLFLCNVKDETFKPVDRSVGDLSLTDQVFILI